MCSQAMHKMKKTALQKQITFMPYVFFKKFPIHIQAYIHTISFSKPK